MMNVSKPPMSISTLEEKLASKLCICNRLQPYVRLERIPPDVLKHGQTRINTYFSAGDSAALNCSDSPSSRLPCLKFYRSCANGWTKSKDCFKLSKEISQLPFNRCAVMTEANAHHNHTLPNCRANVQCSKNYCNTMVESTLCIKSPCSDRQVRNTFKNDGGWPRKRLASPNKICIQRPDPDCHPRTECFKPVRISGTNDSDSVTEQLEQEELTQNMHAYAHQFFPTKSIVTRYHTSIGTKITLEKKCAEYSTGSEASNNTFSVNCCTTNAAASDADSEQTVSVRSVEQANKLNTERRKTDHMVVKLTKLNSEAELSTIFKLNPVTISHSIQTESQNFSSVNLKLLQTKKDSEKSVVSCHWNGCTVRVPSSRLYEHIRSVHIARQLVMHAASEKPKFACLWTGCKVYNRPSTIQSWIEGHVICHLGARPYPCVFDSCKRRFASRNAFGHHVSRHFGKHGTLMERKKDTKTRVHKCRRKQRGIQPCTAVRRTDYIDSDIMNAVQDSVSQNMKLIQPFLSSCRSLIKFKSKICGSRTDVGGNEQVLLRWSPTNILVDEWVDISQLLRDDYLESRDIPLSLLPDDVILESFS